jgi:DNA (cytosine-5)-methyltransferase 1
MTDAHDLRFQDPEWVDTTSIPTSPAYSVVGLCSGCGGLDLGFTMAGYEAVLAIECDPHAADTYRTNFPRARLIDREVQTVADAEILAPLEGRTADVLCCGLPCQAYSKSGGMDPMDARAWLFSQLVRVADLLAPHVIVVENVVNLQGVHGGVFFRWIVTSLASVGYDALAVAVLNAAAYGVPQARERLIIVANRHRLPCPFPSPLLAKASWRTVRDAIGDLADLERGAVPNHEWPEHRETTTRRLEGLEPGASLNASYRQAWLRLHADRPALTVMSNNGGSAVHPWLPRTLSVREMARLQGFPDWFRFEGGMTTGRVQVGNAVPPPLAQHVALALRPALAAVAGRAA